MQAVVGAIKPRADRLAQLIAPYAGTNPAIPELGWRGSRGSPMSIPVGRCLTRCLRPCGGATTTAIRQPSGTTSSGWDSTSRVGPWNCWLPGCLPVRESLAQDEGGRPVRLEFARSQPAGAGIERSSGSARPLCQRLIPYLLTAMAADQAGARSTASPTTTSHSVKTSSGPMPNLGEALLHGAATALAHWRPRSAGHCSRSSIYWQPPVRQRPVAVVRGAARERRPYAERAAELLLEGDHRFPSGYLSSPYWTTRQLLEATTPHMSDDHFARLEAAIMAYAPSWESR